MSSVAGASQPSASAAQPSAAPFSFTADTVHSFPPAFLAFLRDNDIHVDNYRITDVPRYLRVSPRASLTQAELERQLGTSCEPVAWLPGYFRLRGDVKIATSDAYRAGHIYGIDVSSGAAVAALDPQPGEHVLDLCCAPGAKLCAIADAMGLRGSVTGVDVSAERLARLLPAARSAKSAALLLLVHLLHHLLHHLHRHRHPHSPVLLRQVRRRQRSALRGRREKLLRAAAAPRIRE